MKTNLPVILNLEFRHHEFVDVDFRNDSGKQIKFTRIQFTFESESYNFIAREMAPAVNFSRDAYKPPFVKGEKYDVAIRSFEKDGPVFVGAIDSFEKSKLSK